MTAGTVFLPPSRPVVTHRGHGLGWRAQRPDIRDLYFRLDEPVKVPDTFSLRGFCPPVYDQGQLGSCTANALAFAYEFDLMRQKLPSFTPSRLFIYYNERVIEGDPGVDGGAIIRDGANVLHTLGVVPEEMWQYVVAQFAIQPAPALYAEALQHRSVEYRAVQQTAPALQTAVASGFPVVFGFTVYESFESPQVESSGMAPMPAPGEHDLGGHAVAIIGYDRIRSLYECRNSWGTGWGESGYFWLPAAYVENDALASDFWVISTVAA